MDNGTGYHPDKPVNFMPKTVKIKKISGLFMISLLLA